VGDMVGRGSNTGVEFVWAGALSGGSGVAW
jgi:hypothetical protein